MKGFRSKKEWKKIINKTYERWQFPNAYAAVDGKHIGVICPPDSGSDFYNYKGFYSVVLMAFVDFDYRFIFAKGAQGKISDGGIFRNSVFNERLQKGLLDLPQPFPKSYDPDSCSEEQSDEKQPIVFVADDASPLTVNCMKPFSKISLADGERILNYRVSRFRRVSENAFGIWINRFRLFANKAALGPGKIEIIVLASLVLHNMLRTLPTSLYTPVEFVDTEADDGTIIPGSWGEEALPSNIAELQPDPHVKVNLLLYKFELHLWSILWDLDRYHGNGTFYMPRDKTFYFGFIQLYLLHIFHNIYHLYCADLIEPPICGRSIVLFFSCSVYIPISFSFA